MLVPESPRLTFRPLSAQDLSAFHALVVDPHVLRFLFDARAMPKEWAQAAVQTSLRSFEERGVGLWLVEERDQPGKGPIGFAGFWVFEEHGPWPQLLYAFRERWSGRGYATEAAESLITFARQHARMGEIHAAVDDPNRASIRVLEKLGFERTGAVEGAFGPTFIFRLAEGRPPLRMRTGRLLLRPWRDEDLEPFAALNADPRVMEHFTGTLIRGQSDVLATRLRTLLEETGYGLWAVEVLGGAPFIGFAGLAQPGFEAHFTPCVEIGWRLAAGHWGRGYATEAAQAVLRAAFVHLRLEEVVSFTVPSNVRSIRVMEKLGMRRDEPGDFDHPRLPEGHPLRRHVLYRIDKARWLERVAEGPRSP